eukprot:PITA_15034
MAGELGRGEIPSYKSATAVESSGKGTQRDPKENSKDPPVMGTRWQAGLGDRCLPRALKNPGYWPSKKDMSKWIQQRWKPKRHIDLKLGAKGFFTVILSNLEDKERIFEGGPYFMNNAGLFMWHWEDCYNPDQEKMIAAPIWIRLFGLPIEFWDPEILEGIGNTIRTFIKVAETIRRGRYTSYARICVYMNISEPLPEYIGLEYHDEVWQQPVDYEHIPFHCRRCHEYGHLLKQFPLNVVEETSKK